MSKVKEMMSFQQNMPIQQPNPIENVLLSRLRSIHLAYASFVDSNGQPVSLPAQGQIFSNEEKCEFDAILYTSTRLGEDRNNLKHAFSQRRQDEVRFVTHIINTF